MATRSTSQRKAPTAKETLESIQAPEPDQPPEQPPGVAVLRVKGEGGKEEIRLMPLGGMDVLAIPTLLQLALKIDRQSLGLEDA